jgi:hypothetical protein
MLTLTTQSRREFVAGALGRRLKNWEHIHHIDGNHSNDGLDNLVVIPRGTHQQIHRAESPAFGPEKIYLSVALEMLHIAALDISL